jgi:hypothetical protein
MVRLSVATLSLAALAGVAIVNAQPIEYVLDHVHRSRQLDSYPLAPFSLESGSFQLASRAEEVSDLAERGALYVLTVYLMLYLTGLTHVLSDQRPAWTDFPSLLQLGNRTSRKDCHPGPRESKQGRPGPG